MDDSVNLQRLEELRKMILKLACGDFSYRVELNNKQDDIASFGLMLNLLAEELGSFLTHPNAFGEKDLQKPYALLIDNEFNIIGANRIFINLLKYSKDKVINQPIQNFIHSNSYKNFKKQVRGDQKDTQYALVIKLILTFLPFNSAPIDCWGYCYKLTSFKKSYYFIRGLCILNHINSFEGPISSQSFHTQRVNTVLQFQADIQKIRAVHQFILEHLHEPLPPISTISRLFHINEYKLKKGFKELYQITIFKFHLEKRLDQAMVMIKNTPTSLKVISYSLGFKSFPHFSRVFKIKFGSPPSHFRKNNS